MFTGLIEEVGTIQSVRRGARSCVLTIGCRTVLEGSQIGDSIAVNGVCLTVTSMGGSYYTADVMAETMNRSSLGQLSTGAKVNLERAMPANGRFGGHIVSGHIDGTGTVQRIEPDDNAVWYTIAAKADLLRYIVEKGSITIDGISLTVAYVDEHCFKVSIIPHTQQVTALHDRKVGDIVNLECDIIGKYVEKLMRPAPVAEEQDTKKESGITEDFLKKYGF
ncbi:riboflavin synthase [Eubacterium ramulus]|uniref:riboflavin synthase n=1 Tax=uncultured Eubacterium sp. TaxID=165185 RepID=UPI002591847D|nr:riboflavin synthase [uncultured Eubacterium sp.]